MPAVLKPAAASVVMPKGLSMAFQEVLYLDADIDEYADGRSTRRVLAVNARRSFVTTRPLTDAKLAELRTFYLTVARYGKPFYMYNLRETAPPGSWDSTGASTVGRYTVVWEGGWQESLNLSRHQVSFKLREVA